MWIRFVRLSAVCSFVLILITGCNKTSDEKGGTQGNESQNRTSEVKPPAKPIDTSDPKSVALGFLQAVSERRFDDAAQHVHPRTLSDFRSVVREQSSFSLPLHPVITVRTSGKYGNVLIENYAGLRLGIQREDGRWWMFLTPLLQKEASEYRKSTPGAKLTDVSGLTIDVPICYPDELGLMLQDGCRLRISPGLLRKIALESSQRHTVHFFNGETVSGKIQGDVLTGYRWLGVKGRSK